MPRVCLALSSFKLVAAMIKKNKNKNMNLLTNAFSLLELDADDDRLTTAPASSISSKPTTNKTGKSKKTVNKSNLVTSSEEYKMPLVWIDLEMSGLNIEVDRILEIACIITDGNLTNSVEVVEFVKRHVGTYTPLLAGNSVYVDFMFLKKYKLDLASLFSHVVVDVSSVNALCMHWYPRDKKKAPQKENKHRALDDIRESIMELKYYKANIFKPKSKK